MIVRRGLLPALFCSGAPGARSRYYTTGVDILLFMPYTGVSKGDEEMIWINVAPLTDAERKELERFNNSLTSRLQRFLKKWGK